MTSKSAGPRTVRSQPQTDQPSNGDPCPSPHQILPLQQALKTTQTRWFASSQASPSPSLALVSREVFPAAAAFWQEKWQLTVLLPASRQGGRQEMDSTRPSSWELPELLPPASPHLLGFDPPWKHTIPPQGAQSPGLSTGHQVSTWLPPVPRSSLLC